MYLTAQFLLFRISCNDIINGASTSVDSPADQTFRSSLSRVNTVRKPATSTPHAKSTGDSDCNSIGQ